MKLIRAICFVSMVIMAALAIIAPFIDMWWSIGSFFFIAIEIAYGKEIIEWSLLYREPQRIKREEQEKERIAKLMSLNWAEGFAKASKMFLQDRVNNRYSINDLMHVVNGILKSYGYGYLVLDKTARNSENPYGVIKIMVH